jgi:hypothetical protein
MYGNLRTNQRKKIYTGYVPNTFSPKQLVGQGKLTNEKVMDRNPYPDLPLEQGLKVSYENDLNKAQEDLNPYGYKIDNELSNKETKVFYNPLENKMVFSVAGTDMFNSRDLATDAYLAFLGNAGLKMTNRYKEAESVLDKARTKYKGSEKVLIGHSLGNSVISNLAKENEKVLGFGTGSGFYQTAKAPLEQRFRTFYDPLSLTSGAKTIPAYIPEKKGNLRKQNKVDYPQGVLPSHSFENLKSIPVVFV